MNQVPPGHGRGLEGGPLTLLLPPSLPLHLHPQTHHGPRAGRPILCPPSLRPPAAGNVPPCDVHGVSGVGELRGAVHVIHEVAPAMGRESDLPAVWKGPQLRGVDIQISESRVVPRAYSCAPVDEVDLALGGRALLWGEEGGNTGGSPAQYCEGCRIT